MKNLSFGRRVVSLILTGTMMASAVSMEGNFVISRVDKLVPEKINIDAYLATSKKEKKLYRVIDRHSKKTLK